MRSPYEPSIPVVHGEENVKACDSEIERVLQGVREPN